MHILVAMSGGVDSTIAAALLLRQGHEVAGVTMMLWDGVGQTPPRRRCVGEDIEVAATMCRFLGIPHQVVDFRQQFLEMVVRPFCDSYLSGRTPNPCVVCNEVMKSKLLLEHALRVGAEALATGHYARIEKGGTGGGAVLLRAVDREKDQSYFLHRIAPEHLKRMVFPLGGFSKAWTRELAKEMGLAVASKRDSQEVCFVSAGGYHETVEMFGKVEVVRGAVTYKGDVLFRHEGIHHFTVGQRCGAPAGKGGQRLYVRRINAASGEIEAATAPEMLSPSMLVSDIVWHHPPREATFDAEVQIRYRHKAIPSRVVVLDRDKGKVSVSFSSPQLAVAPGQAAVFYSGDRVLGGGWIEEAS